MEFVKVAERDGDVILRDAAGRSARFEFLEMARVGGREYAALLEAGEAEPVLLRMLEDGPGERYAVIDDDAEFEAVRAAFERLFEED